MRLRQNSQGRWVLYDAERQPHQGNISSIRIRDGRLFYLESSDDITWAFEGEIKRANIDIALLESLHRHWSGNRPLDRPSAPRFLSLLSARIPKYLEDHKQEILQFAEDGLTDRTVTGQSPKWFLLRETLALICLAVNAKVFFFRKAKNRSVK